MFAAAPVYAAPTELRDRILAGARSAPTTPYRFVADGGFPAVVRSATRVAAWLAPAAAAGLLLVVGGAVITFARSGDTADGIAILDSVEAPVTTSATMPIASTTAPPTTTPVDATELPGTVSPDTGTPTCAGRRCAR